MPSVSKDKLKATAPTPGAEMREVNWGGMNVSFVSIKEPALGMDMAPLFKGLPDDRCQTPHWGYVLKGSLKMLYADRNETFTAGQIYYIEPGHIPNITEPTEFIEFSREEEMLKTMEVMTKNKEEAKLAKERS